MTTTDYAIEFITQMMEDEYTFDDALAAAEEHFGLTWGAIRIICEEMGE